LHDTAVAPPAWAHASIASSTKRGPDRYSALAHALWDNPDLRFPNIDKVLPLPPALLPQWDSNPDSLIDAAKGVRLAPQPITTSASAPSLEVAVGSLCVSA
jgi:hypothetical protein